jgi:hypothetical protein
LEKPSNLVVKLADFGLARIVDQMPMKTLCGTPHYVAPEIIFFVWGPFENKNQRIIFKVFFKRLQKKQEELVVNHPIVSKWKTVLLPVDMEKRSIYGALG